MNRMPGSTLVAAAVVAAGSVAYGCGGSSGSTPGNPEGGSQEAAVREAAASSGSSAPDVTVPALGCPVPDALSAYTLPAYAPAKRAPNACTKQEILDYVASFMSSQAARDLDAYRQNHAACAGCLESASADATWGPLVFWPNGQTELNTSGCLEILSAGTGCATKVQAIDQCSHAACDVTCALAPPSYTQQCTTSAYAGPCMTYASASLCAQPDAGGTPEALCKAGPSLGAQLPQVAPYFCGGGGAVAGDAGTTRGPDSSAGGGGAGADASSSTPRDAARDVASGG